MIEPISRVRPKATPISQAAGSTVAYIFADVLSEIRFNGDWQPDQIAGGLLVGHPYKSPDNDQAYVEIEGFIAGTHGADVDTFTRHLRIQWKAAETALGRHFPDAELVGWYLAGVEEGTEPDADVVILHNTFFNRPWQIGLWVPADNGPPSALMVDSTGLEPVPIAEIREASDSDSLAPGNEIAPDGDS